MSDAMQRLYARLSEKELRVQIRNDNAVSRAGSLHAAYGSNPSRVVPGRGEWAGTFWCLKGEISDGPFTSLIDAENCGRELDGRPLLPGFPRTTPPTQPRATTTETNGHE